MRLNVYVSFEDLYEAIEYDKIAKERGLSGKLVSVPRKISSGCGYAWRTRRHSVSQLQQMMEDIKFSAIHDLS